MKIKYFLAAAMLFVLVSVSASAGNVGKCDIVFFGDSTTAHLKLRGGIPEENVWSGSANTVLFSTVNDVCPVYLPDEGRSVTLREAVRLKKPEILVITLGVSGGAGFVPEAKFKSIYRELICSVRESSPETRIFVQSILPLSDKSVLHYSRLTKEAVLEANEWIKQVCAECGIAYIDSHSLLTDETGYLKKIYQNDEYMHLTSEAYSVITDNVLNYVNKN